MDKKTTLAAAALAALSLATGCAGKSGTTEAVVKGECHGVNACKGQGECGGTGHACAGKNACKGQGWIGLVKTDCEGRGGTFKN
ncbi:MAG: hypothetical protein HYZ74_01840 [Elusimicrobia bacterium]|nr:hypothetical protein [Elusimicrobiota bacterium]